MVEKGAGYSLEAIVAVATVFIFMFGALDIPSNQNWSQFREQTSAEDVTYALQKTGYINHALRNGETGSIQTAFSTVTERSTEVSGLVSNLPINDNRVGFYIINSERYTQNLRTIQSGDTCEGDLEEISTRSEEPVLRTTGGALADDKNSVIYLGDLDPANSTIGSGDGVTNYDSLWVDNGTECQFSNSEGPYSIEEIFKWDNGYYDFKSADASSDTMRLYNATQPVRFREVLRQRVNDVKTFTTVDTVNFSRLDSRTYNTVAFRKEQSLDDVSNNREIVEEFLETGSILFLADLDQSYFEPGDFLSDAGFRYVDVPYQGSPSWDGGYFPNSEAPQEVSTYFRGLNGQEVNLNIDPSTTVISDSERYLESGDPLLKSSERYDFSVWDTSTSSMNAVDPSSVDGEPSSECYVDSSGNDRDRALTETTNLGFPESSVSVINAELGSSDSYCNNNNDRAIKIDFDDDGDYQDASEGPFLNGETVIIDDRQYGVTIIPAASDSSCDEGDCLEFVYIGDRGVEIIPRRTSFPGLNGEKIALTGYQSEYSTDDLKVLTSTINWLRGDQVSFTGQEQPEGLSTSTFSAVQNRTYMPYELNLRWSR